MMAQDMIDLMIERMIEHWTGQQMDQAALEAWIRREARSLLSCQIQQRGLAPDGFAATMASRITLGVDGGHATVYVGDPWLEEVDRTFHAGPCARCGHKVPVPWDHPEDECDAFVVRDVIES